MREKKVGKKVQSKPTINVDIDLLMGKQKEAKLLSRLLKYKKKSGKSYYQIADELGFSPNSNVVYIWTTKGHVPTPRIKMVSEYLKIANKRKWVNLIELQHY